MELQVFCVGNKTSLLYSMSTLRTLHSISRQLIKRKLIRSPKQKYMQCYYFNNHISKRSIHSSKFYRIQQIHYKCYNIRRFSSSQPSSNKGSSKDVDNDRDDKIDKDDDYSSIDHRLFNPPTIRDIRKWDKFEWIFSVSSLFQFLGFLSYDFILLRCFSLLSASGLMIAHRGRSFFVGWFWCFSFATANIIALYFMLGLDLIITAGNK